MRLKQEQFVPFMIAVGILTMVIIIYSSFRFNNKQYRIFEENLAESDSLTTMKMRIVGVNDSVSVADLNGNKSLLVFWASWSDKSRSMLDEIQLLQNEHDSLKVIAALVKDAEESLSTSKEYANFYYTDGIKLYNYLQVPGFPSYVLFDENSEVLSSNIGYEKGIGYDSLKVLMQ
jgi:thiol-disulfide isomerase/thioredoxin